jgi:hypothetical protein
MSEGSVEFDEFMAKSTSDSLEFCNLLFSSPDPTLRNLSSQSYFCLTRSILTGKSTAIKDLWGLNYSKLVTDYFFVHKNHSLNSHKILDEYISRFPDGVVGSVLDVLVSAMTKAKTAYLQGEAYRLLELILKRFHQLQDPANKGQILERYAQILGNIFEIFQSLDGILSDATTGATAGTNGPLKVKRFKPLLQLTKTLFGFLKSMLRCDGSSVETRSYELLLSLPNVEDKQRFPLSVDVVRQMKAVFVSGVDAAKGRKQGDKMETEGITTESLEEQSCHPYRHLFRWIKQNPSLKGIFEQLHHQIKDIAPPPALPVAHTTATPAPKKGSEKVSGSKKAKEAKGQTKGKERERDYERELVQSYREMSELRVSPGEGDAAKGKESKKRGAQDAVMEKTALVSVGEREEGESEGKRKKAKKEKKSKATAS